MSWKEIKATPRHELVGLLGATSNYNILHQFDGYSAEEISKLAKDKPQLRSQYADSMELKAKYESRAGKERVAKSFKDMIG